MVAKLTILGQPVEFENINYSGHKFDRFEARKGSGSDGPGWFIYGFNDEKYGPKQYVKLVARPDVPPRKHPHYNIRVRAGWKTKAAAQQIADALNVQKNPRRKSPMLKNKPIAKRARKTARRLKRSQGFLTAAAIARAHRNPDIHIDIGSHNATRAAKVRTNPKKPRKQIRQRRRQEKMDRASSMYKIQIKEGLTWITHGFSSDLDTAKRYARTLNATEKKPVRVMD